jgi:hypothetical protein
MTTESTLPQSEMGPSPANGQGQSQGHRRRRRRRKNKTSQTSQQAQQPQQPQAQQQPAPVAVAPPAAPPPAQARPPRQASQQNNGSQSQPRKKKKAFQKSSAPAPQPGNNSSASFPPQGKQRKSSGGKQRGPREFVGPMDHSYRTVDGNVADRPASTTQISSGGYAGYYQESFAPQPTVAVREDAVTRIFCFIEDLFFLAKIQESARKLGVKVEFVKGDKETLTRLTELPENQKPALLVFDLNNLAAKPMTLIPKYKAKLKKATSIVGFLNHLQGDLKLKAIEAGCDTVMPRSAFSQSLPNMLRRYGIEDEEDHMPQPV